MQLVISPTMRCNLLCPGCHVGEYRAIADDVWEKEYKENNSRRVESARYS